ncbi:MAG: hypothetical protein AB8G11_22660 [Saprospiraceae bacterium]
MENIDDKFLEDYWCNEMYFKKDSYNQLPFIEIELPFYNEKEDSITIAQKNTFDYINSNQKKVIDALYDGIIQEYPKFMIYCLGEEEYNEDDVPKIKTFDDVDDNVSLGSLYLLDDELDGFAYYGFAGSCDWDEEHGFGMLMY